MSSIEILLEDTITNTFNQNAHYQILGEQLCVYYNDSRYSDIAITVSGRKFYGHKIILSLVSTYFDAMFHAGMVESQTGEVNLHDIKAETFKLVLEYIYTGKTSLTVDVAQELLLASNMLQIPVLTNTCATFMASHITVNNCFQLLQVADSLSLENLYHTVKLFILDEFDRLGEAMEGIVNLSKDLLIDVIQDDHLASTQETEVYECVMKWMEHDESRMQYLGEVCQYVRFPLLPSDYFIAVNNNTKLRNDPTCLSYINEALEYQMLPSKRNSLSSPRIHLRKKSNFKDVVYIITPSQKLEFSITLFDLSAMNLEPRSYLSEAFPRSYLSEALACKFSSCHYNGVVYMCGGSNSCSGEACSVVQKFDLSTKIVSKCKSMPHPRYNHECIALGKYMVVIGGIGLDGYTEDRIDIYSFNHNTWETLTSSVVSSVAQVSAIQFQDKIYFFGGLYSVETQDLSSDENICSFDPKAQDNNQIFERLCAMPVMETTVYLRAVAVGEQIFVLYTYTDDTRPNGISSKYFLYCPATDSLAKTGDVPQAWIRYSVVYYEGYVFVIGARQGRYSPEEHLVRPGVRSIAHTSAIHRYSVGEDKWEVGFRCFPHACRFSSIMRKIV